MNTTIEERFKKQNQSWDFTTVIDGKVHSHAEIVKQFEAEESAAKEKDRLAQAEKDANNPPVDGEVVQEALREEFGVQEGTATRHVFSGLVDFNSWYLSNKEAFSEGQQTALNQLIEAQEMIGKGCRCGRKQRAARMEAYFMELMTENKRLENDLIPTILMVTGKDEVEFQAAGQTFMIHKK